ncbi:hypothetical protein B194_0045 [Serratia plymuthica A30]|nr:hypothetical protein B194_0045 [Serratia plymuthica A30]
MNLTLNSLLKKLKIRFKKNYNIKIYCCITKKITKQNNYNHLL